VTDEFCFDEANADTAPRERCRNRRADNAAANHHGVDIESA
jgi:hypothetical protein